MDPFIGQIMLCGLAFAPKGWADCNGQLLSIRRYSAVYSLLGTTFGGDGTTNFALPDLRGRVLVGPGTRQGGSTYAPGDQTGVEAIAIRADALPVHGHGMNASPVPGTGQGSGTAAGNSFSTLPGGRGATGKMYAPPPETTRLAAAAASAAGGNATHANVQPYLALRYIIALDGVFPQRP